MIEVNLEEIVGWKPAIVGMRNPMNSWDKSDSVFCNPEGCSECDYDCDEIETVHWEYFDSDFCIGENDMKLMQTLVCAGSEHRKFLRMIQVYVTINAPLYWWKEFDTYKVGTVANSCSTMHKIHSKEFTLDDFSHEHLSMQSIDLLNTLIEHLNICRDKFNDSKMKEPWWNIIQMLPSSYNQKRTVMLNYETAINIIRQRKNHKLNEWRTFVGFLTELPYMCDLIGYGDDK